MREAVVYLSRSEAETRALGVRLGRALRGGERLGLGGDLGAGKTCLVRGIAEGLGIPPQAVRSPSFPVIVPYEGGRLRLHHIDLFRLARVTADALGLREYLDDPQAVAAVEWFGHLAEPLGDFLEIDLRVEGPALRRLVAAPHGAGYDHLLEVLRAREGPWD